MWQGIRIKVSELVHSTRLSLYIYYLTLGKSHHPFPSDSAYCARILSILTLIYL